MKTIGEGFRHFGKLLCFPGSLLWMHVVGLQSTGLQTLSKLRKEPGVRNRDICGLMNKGPYMFERKCPGTTPHCGRQTAGRTGQQASLPGREGDFQLQK